MAMSKEELAARKRELRAQMKANDPERYAEEKRKNRERNNARYAADPEYRARVNARNKEAKRLERVAMQTDPAVRDRVNAQWRKWYYANGGKEQAARKRANRAARGVCRLCATPVHARSSMCEKHHWMVLCNNHGLPTSQWEMLRALAEAQDYKCAYSGVPLVLSKGLTIDHVIPKKSPFYPGDHDFTNMKIVHRRVNTAKNDMPLDEFLRMVENVYNVSVVPRYTKQ